MLLSGIQMLKQQPEAVLSACAGSRLRHDVQMFF